MGLEYFWFGSDLWSCWKMHEVRFSTKILLGIFFVSYFLPCAKGVFRYSLDSCTDLSPRQTDQSAHHDHYNSHYPTWHSGHNVRNRRSDSHGYDNEQPPAPVRLTVPVNRYRISSDLHVQIEGEGYYEALMLQGRVVGSAGEFIPGGVGLVGRFDPSHFHGHRTNFSHLECFRQPYGTVVDSGNTPRMGNMSFVWTSPDSDSGSIRFLAGITQGIYYWIIVSNILHFNPFPISTVQCGGAEACFRVCPLDSYTLCTSRDALVMYAYNTDWIGKREVEFTLGGTLDVKNAYLGVVYAEDNDNLLQADVIVCYVEHGKAQLVHLRLETLGSVFQHHPEEIILDDYDIDGNMLWCRYRRPISQSSVINPWKSYYTLLYRGDLDLYRYPRFQTPARSRMYSSDMKHNLTTSLNKIYAGSLQLAQFSSRTLITLTVTCLFLWHLSLGSVSSII